MEQFEFVFVEQDPSYISKKIQGKVDAGHWTPDTERQQYFFNEKTISNIKILVV